MEIKWLEWILVGHRRRYSAFKVTIIIVILATDLSKFSQNEVKPAVPAFL